MAASAASSSSSSSWLIFGFQVLCPGRRFYGLFAIFDLHIPSFICFHFFLTATSSLPLSPLALIARRRQLPGLARIWAQHSNLLAKLLRTPLPPSTPWGLLLASTICVVVFFVFCYFERASKCKSNTKTTQQNAAITKIMLQNVQITHDAHKWENKFKKYIFFKENQTNINKGKP